MDKSSDISTRTTYTFYKFIEKVYLIFYSKPILYLSIKTSAIVGKHFAVVQKSRTHMPDDRVLVE